MEIIKQNELYALILEKIAGEWWLKFVELKTGITQILFCKTKKTALNAYKCKDLSDCLSLDKIKEICDKQLKLNKVKLYKENINSKQ